MAVLFVLVALVAACVVALQRPWTRIVVRVAGRLDRRPGPVAAGVGPAWRELKKSTGFGCQSTRGRWLGQSVAAGTMTTGRKSRKRSDDHICLWRTGTS